MFAGWFGPIGERWQLELVSQSRSARRFAGVGAVYYAQVGLRRVPEDRTAVRELIVPVVRNQQKLLAPQLVPTSVCLSPGLLYCASECGCARHHHTNIQT